MARKAGHESRPFVCKLCGTFSRQVEAHFAARHPGVPIATHADAKCLNCGKPTKLESPEAGFQLFCNKSCHNSYKLRYTNVRHTVPAALRVPYEDSGRSNVITEAAPLEIVWLLDRKFNIAGVPVSYMMGLKDGRTLALSVRDFYKRPGQLAESLDMFDPKRLQGLYRDLNVEVVLTPSLTDADLPLRVEQARHYAVTYKHRRDKLLAVNGPRPNKELQFWLEHNRQVEWYILNVSFLRYQGGKMPVTSLYKLRGETVPHITLEMQSLHDYDPAIHKAAQMLWQPMQLEFLQPGELPDARRGYDSS